MFKKNFFILIAFCLIFILSSCVSGNINVNSNSSNIKVVVSFNAMSEFAKAIGKNKIDIQLIIPEGTEPHQYEPKAKDLENLGNARIFIYNGLNFETWVDKSLSAVDNKNLLVVNASKGCTPITNVGTLPVNKNSQADPHLWISLKGAEIEAKNIKDALVIADPTNKAYYEKNYTDFYNSLEQLYTEYNTKFSLIKNKDFVTGHAAFAYLCRDFGLKQNSVQDVFADGDPSPQKMTELINFCKLNKVKTIFTENMVSPKVSETLANEVGANTVKIYTIENKEDNKDYLQSMKYNIESIYNSLK
jgi:zinc transport system substrate-binding protein